MNDEARAWLSRLAGQSAAFIEERNRLIEHLELSEVEVAGIRELVDYHQDVLTEIEELVPDADLIASHERAIYSLTEPEVAAMDVEIRRRGLWPNIA